MTHPGSFFPNRFVQESSVAHVDVADLDAQQVQQSSRTRLLRSPNDDGQTHAVRVVLGEKPTEAPEKAEPVNELKGRAGSSQ